MQGFTQDLVLGVRSLVKHKGVNGLAILTLAVAIGSATIVVSILNAALWRPLPYEAPEELIALFRHDRDRDERRNPTTPADFLDWAASSRTLDDFTAAHPFGPMLSGDGPAVRLAGLKATTSLFTLLGVEARLGRVFDESDESDEKDAGDRVVVLSDALWKRLTGGDPSVVGTSLRLDGEAYRVLGVMPPDFFFPPFWATEAELWTPLVFSPSDRAQRRAQFLRVFARLTRGSSLQAARAEMDALAARQRSLHPETNAEAGINLEPLREPAVGGRRSMYAILLGAVALVVLVACANTANLLLARALGREREMALRLALGAGRARLIRQLLVESALLASIAAAAALAMSTLLLELGSLQAAALPFPAEAKLAPTVLGATAGISLATILLFGLAPAVRAARPRYESTLRGRLGRLETRGGTAALRSWLVVTEVALSLALVVSALTLIESFVRLARLDPGFERERVLTLDISLDGTAHTEPLAQSLVFERIEARVAGLPAVEAASFVNHLPIGGDLWRTAFTVAGAEDDASPPIAAHRTVGAGYFETFGIALVAGRSFDGRDAEDGPPVVIINETLAERYFPGTSPLGRSLRLQGGDVQATIVGVARNVKQWALEDPVRPEIYFPYRQNPSSYWKRATLVVRSTLAPESLERSVRSAVADVDPALPLTSGRTMEAILSGSLAAPRLQSFLMSAFAATALFLCLAGVYGVMAFSVRSRRREIGLRMALGASPRRVRAAMMRSGLAHTAGGAAIGCLLALGLTRLSAGLAPDAGRLELRTLAAAVLLVLLAGAAASFIPARQASALSPSKALEETS